MKRYIKYLAVSSFVLGLSLQSCSDDYLEEVNINEVSTAVFGKTLDETNINLTGLYGGLLNQFLWSADYQNYRGDMAYPNLRTRVSSSFVWQAQTFNPSVSGYGRDFAAMYRVIFRANQVITNLNALSPDLKQDKRWAVQMGEARLLRGLMHFYLHSNYNNGSVVIRDKVIQDPMDFSKDLSSATEVQDFFRADLKYAYENLPDVQSQKTRVNKGLAALILGKSHLYAKEYKEATFYLEDVINGPYGYSLLTGDDVSKIYTHAGDYNSESILEINYTAVHQRLIAARQGDTWDEEAYTTRWARYTAPGAAGGGIGGSNYFTPTAWLTYAYSNETVNLNDPRNFRDGNVQKSVPLRCAQMIAVANDEESIYYGKLARDYAGFDKNIFSYFKKYTNHDISTTEEEILSTGWQSSKNYIVYRLSDAYLMLAECLIQEDKISEALTAINTIRDRWGLQLLGPNTDTTTYDGITYDKTSLMEHLMYVEKPLEIGIDGYAERVIDLRRWGVQGKRYKDLAAPEGLYHLIDYNYTNEQGEADTAKIVAQGLNSDEETSPYIEFQQAAINYIENLHAYLPLPTQETLFNLNVK